MMPSKLAKEILNCKMHIKIMNWNHIRVQVIGPCLMMFIVITYTIMICTSMYVVSKIILQFNLVCDSHLSKFNSDQPVAWP